MEGDGVVIKIRAVDLASATIKKVTKRVEEFRGQMYDVSTVSKLVNDKFVVLSKTLSDVKRKFDFNKLSMLFFGMFLKRTFQPILTGLFNTYTKITKGNTALGKATVRLGASFNFLKFTLGRALEPLVPMIDIISRAVGWFSTLNPAIQRTALAITGLLVVGGTLLHWFGSVALGIASLKIAFGGLGVKIAGAGAAITSAIASVTPLGWAIATLIGLVTAFGLAYKNNWLGIKDITDKVVTFLRDHPFATLIAGLMTGIGIVPAFALVWRQAWQGIKDFATPIIDWIGDKISWLNDQLISIINTMKSFIGIRGGIIPKGASGFKSFQQGGMVRQTGLKFLHAGEFVVPKPMVDRGGVGGFNFSPNVTVNITGSTDMGKAEIERAVNDALSGVVRDIDRRVNRGSVNFFG